MEEQQLTEEDLDNAMEGRMDNPLETEDKQQNTADEQPDQNNQQEDQQIPQAAQQDLQGTDQIFPNGPTHNQVENWKQEHRNDIYMTEFENQTYIWRTLSRLEYKQLMNDVGQSDWEGEELVAQTCVLWPEDYGPEEISNGKAGVPSILSDQIMAKSGFAAQSRAQKL